MPLLLLSRLGYVANVAQQNDGVVWVIRLCFSVRASAPQASGLVGEGVSYDRPVELLG